MLSVKTGYIPGTGRAKVHFNKKAGEIFGVEYSNTTQELFWANGPLFDISSQKMKNTVLNQPLDQCIELCSFESISVDEKVMSLQDFPYKTAALASAFGKGRLIVFGPHPEASGLEFKKCILSAISWCANKNV